MTRDGRSLYEIRHLEAMPAFLMTVVGDSDLWMYLSSSGAFTAGRVEPDRCLFPYETDDRLHELVGLSGPVTRVRFEDGRVWRPLDGRASSGGSARTLRRSLVGDSVEFEETDDASGLTYRVEYGLSDEHGVVRRCELALHEGGVPVSFELLDGYLNVMPANVPLMLQQVMSTLVDGYKRSERVGPRGPAVYALESTITDSPEAMESLRANAVWHAGLPDGVVSLRCDAVERFESGQPLLTTQPVTGQRGAYLCASPARLQPGERLSWHVVGDVHLDHAGVVRLRRLLESGADLADLLETSLERDRERLAQLLDRADGAQVTSDTAAVAAHRSNVLFNAMRGGVPLHGHDVHTPDFRRFVRTRHRVIADRHDAALRRLPGTLRLDELPERVRAIGDPQLVRLAHEYLPLTFGRRHGDPSRPWNRFRIRVRDDAGERVTGYEGNWRDIFQNWEAVCRAYPAMLPGVIAKFLNASTADGYNPYRINERGIDWEVPEPENPRSNIGYWGDHQVVYLLRLLEQCRDTTPGWLASIAERAVFTYADVPYRIRPFEEIAANPRSSIRFDEELDATLRRRAADLGGDGTLLLDSGGDPLLVTLLEKLLVVALAKVSNLAPGGGVWMNTQRPEWNDANNALAGYGLSMVTLYQLRRYASFCLDFVEQLGEGVTPVSKAVAGWCDQTAGVMVRSLEAMEQGEPIDDESRWGVLQGLGQAAERARESLYESGPGKPTSLDRTTVADFFRLARHFCDKTIRNARRKDGLFESYRVLHLGDGRAGVESLAPMLEGQVAVLASGVLEPREACELLDRLFDSPLYRNDQHTFILYPRADLPAFLDRNVIPEDALSASPLLSEAVQTAGSGLASRDADGHARFDADLVSREMLEERLGALRADEGWADLVRRDAGAVRHAYERTFRHARFMGRSGSMHKYEGLGSVYWHMVSKLLLSVQECVFQASDAGADPALIERLRAHYHRVRAGLGYRKSPAEFGAVPHEPYSHTPWGAGAQQPGLPGPVKEGGLARYGELGVRLRDGGIVFDPVLLSPGEPLEEAATLLVRDTPERRVEVPQGCVGFTLCATPVVLGFADSDSIELRTRDGGHERLDGRALGPDWSREIFGRTGRVESVRVTLGRG
ncbi:MAG: hypothetical protein ACF8Q5_06165 [Phycisphaerales bacterium JB040]